MKKWIILVFAFMVLVGFAGIVPFHSANNYSNTTNNSTFISTPSPTGYNQTSLISNSTILPIFAYVPLVNLTYLSFYSKAVETPGNPYYKHFLSPSEINSEFVNQAQVKKVESNLINHGFSISSEEGSIIYATGTVAQMHNIGMKVGIYRTSDSTFYYAYGTPTIPGVEFYSSNVTMSMFGHPSTMVTPREVNSTAEFTSGQSPPVSDSGYSLTSLQKVYNATGLYSMGISGSGQNIGILDFYGDPYIQSQLQYFDQEFGLVSPASLKIVPIGPYNPALGISAGWADEISLDVESAHTMAPNASITLFAANPNLPLSYILASIISSSPTVRDLSQSFSIAESQLADFAGNAFFFNIYLVDFYYEMGNAEGITFMASTGDTGGSGFSAGPIGTPGYPSTSPYVTAVGGTTTYLVFSNNQVVAYNQTAWSNYGFVPDFVNYGGSTGGASSFEVAPWYQMEMLDGNPFAISSNGYPSSRLVPDVSFEAAVYPGMEFVFPGNVTEISGGTSEASPLFAGLVALLDQYIGSPVGNINPEIYAIHEGAVNNKGVFNQITYGYNIPWVSGEPLRPLAGDEVTGFGSLNIGAFALAYKNLISSVSDVYIFGGTIIGNSSEVNNNEYPDGSVIGLNITIQTPSHTLVTSGSFSASLNWIQQSGFYTIITTSLTYDPTTGTWMGNLTSNGDGVASITIYSDSATQLGLTLSTEATSIEIFTGYYAYSSLYLPTYGYDLQMGLPMEVETSWVNGTGVNVPVNYQLWSYSILNNTYYSGSVPVQTMDSIGNNLSFGYIIGSYPIGVTLISGLNVFFSFPFYNGADLQTTILLGSQQIEPGSVAPGQNITVVPGILCPLNNFDPNIASGSNFTVELVNSLGTVISSVYTDPLNIAELKVPTDATSGLYTLLIHTQYNQFSTGETVNGSFYGQIWVSPNSITPIIEAQSAVMEGQNLFINVSIDQFGHPVEFGMYTATIYPADLVTQYTAVSYNVSVPLSFNSTTSMWQGVIQIPSGYNAGSLSSLENGLPDWAGPYDINVFGSTWNGTPVAVSPSVGFSLTVENPLIVQISADLKEINANITSLGNKISSQIDEINGNVSNLNASVTANINDLKSNIASLSASLTDLSNELATVNETYHTNTTQLQNEISADQATLASDMAELSKLTSEASSNKSGVTTSTVIGSVGAGLGVIGTALALIFRRKK